LAQTDRLVKLKRWLDAGRCLSRIAHRCSFAQ